jgi:2-polyprenyl-6-methoxyphenol hydroxylase-like FAD-dependent oxidoreductase
MNQPQPSPIDDPAATRRPAKRPAKAPATRSERRPERRPSRRPGSKPGGRLRVAVVGGSLTGPTTALLLLNAGFDNITLYEAVPNTAPRGGGLIGLDHSSLDILDRLGVAQDEFVKYTSEAVMHIAVRDRQPTLTGRQLYAGRNTTWTLLHHALTRRLPAEVLRTGRRVTALTERHDQTILRFADGDTQVADLVIFADGRSSVGRRMLDPQRRLRYAGYVAHRGQITTTLPDLHDFLRFEPSQQRGMQFNIAPIPGGADWTFYLPATHSQYETLFGVPPTRKAFVFPQHITPAARAQV